VGPTKLPAIPATSPATPLANPVASPPTSPATSAASPATSPAVADAPLIALDTPLTALETALETASLPAWATSWVPCSNAPWTSPDNAFETVDSLIPTLLATFETEPDIFSATREMTFLPKKVPAADNDNSEGISNADPSVCFFSWKAIDTFCCNAPAWFKAFVASLTAFI